MAKLKSKKKTAGKGHKNILRHIIVIFSLLLLIGVTVVFSQYSQVYTGHAETIPSPVCLGPCAMPLTTAPTSFSVSIFPTTPIVTAGTVTSAPLGGSGVISGQRVHRHTSTNTGSGGSNFIQQFLQLLINLIMKILQLLGLGGGTPAAPSQPSVSGTPSSSPLPSVAGEASPGPSGISSVTVAPTSAPATAATAAPVTGAPTAGAAPAGLTYIAMGNVPATGMQVGATFYGALDTPVNGHYVMSNCLQGGSEEQGGAYELVNGTCENATGSSGLDDNGQGDCGGKYNDLANQSTWAEDGTASDINSGVLGSLPCGTKLAITYHGHTIVAEKGDISDGGCSGSDCPVNGTLRAIDLWWQTAMALCFSNQPDVMTIHVVPSSTPTTTIVPYSASNPATTAVCN